LFGLTSDGISHEDSLVSKGGVGCPIRATFWMGFDMLEVPWFKGIVKGVAT